MQLIFIQSLTSPYDDGLGRVEPFAVPLGRTASTLTSIMIPMVVKTLTIIIPCSLNSVFSLSPRVVLFQDLVYRYSYSIYLTTQCIFIYNGNLKVSKGAKIRNRYNQVPHLTQETNGKVTTSQLDTTNGSQEVKPETLLIFKVFYSCIYALLLKLITSGYLYFLLFICNMFIKTFQFG